MYYLLNNFKQDKATEYNIILREKIKKQNCLIVAHKSCTKKKGIIDKIL